MTLVKCLNELVVLLFEALEISKETNRKLRAEKTDLSNKNFYLRQDLKHAEQDMRLKDKELLKKGKRAGELFSENKSLHQMYVELEARLKRQEGRPIYGKLGPR